MLVNRLFGAVNITKNADIDKHKYSGYGIGFDGRGLYLLTDGRFGRNLVVFGVDMNASPHIDNNGKDILILGKGSRIRWAFINHRKNVLSFTDNGDKYCASLHYNRANSYLFVNGVEIIKFKAKDSNIIAAPLCLGNISKDWSTDNIKYTFDEWICLWF